MNPMQKKYDEKNHLKDLKKSENLSHLNNIKIIKNIKKDYDMKNKKYFKFCSHIFLGQNKSNGELKKEKAEDPLKYNDKEELNKKIESYQKFENMLRVYKHPIIPKLNFNLLKLNKDHIRINSSSRKSKLKEIDSETNLLKKRLKKNTSCLQLRSPIKNSFNNTKELFHRHRNIKKALNKLLPSLYDAVGSSKNEKNEEICYANSNSSVSKLFCDGITSYRSLDSISNKDYKLIEESETKSRKPPSIIKEYGDMNKRTTGNKVLFAREASIFSNGTKSIISTGTKLNTSKVTMPISTKESAKSNIKINDNPPPPNSVILPYSSKNTSKPNQPKNYGSPKNSTVYSNVIKEKSIKIFGKDVSISSLIQNKKKKDYYSKIGKINKSGCKLSWKIFKNQIKYAENRSRSVFKDTVFKIKGSFIIYCKAEIRNLDEVAKDVKAYSVDIEEIILGSEKENNRRTKSEVIENRIKEILENDGKPKRKREKMGLQRYKESSMHKYIEECRKKGEVLRQETNSSDEEDVDSFGFTNTGDSYFPHPKMKKKKKPMGK